MTRTWEIEDNKGALPVDLVREQDFILRLRRLQRIGTPHLAINLVFSAIPALTKHRQVLEGMQAKLMEFAKVTNGTYADMTNGDGFVVWEETADAELLADRLVSVFPSETHKTHESSSYLLTYHLPQDYTKLRERVNHYVEVARTSTVVASDNPATALKSESARGPLTPWGLSQIGQLLDDIDVRAYARTQPIYQHGANDTWTAVSEEYFISFEDLRRERFPKLDLITPEHLFFALCEMIDQKLLSHFAEGNPPLSGRALNINLSIASVVGNVFAQFTHSVPRDKRHLLTFELHRGDIFQDFSRTLSAIEVLRKEGFKVAFDSITPDMLPYINLTSFDIDQVKLNVSGERAALLKLPAISKALRALSPEKLVFFRCDSDMALQLGLDIGVGKFQGWKIDDLVGPVKGTGKK